LTRGLDALAASPLLLLAASITVNALLLPYKGLHQDAILYGVQTLNRVQDGYYAQDLYLRYGSQDRYTIFSVLAAGWVRIFGLPVAFFLLYLLFNTAFLWAVQRLLFALVPTGRLAVLGTFAVAGLPIEFGGLGIFHVNEPFLTPRILANALVLLALERTLRGRTVVAFVLLAFALMMHPLMAFGGLLIVLAWCLAQWLSLRWLCALALAAGLAAAGLLLDAPLAMRLFGSMDADWRREVLAINFNNFPEEWLAVDWLRIFCATIIVLVARAMLPLEAREPRRLLAIIPGVAWLGIMATAIACELPYALPFQGQPYRAVWILQLLEVPLGVYVTVRWWRMESWGRMFAAAWVASWLSVFVRAPIAFWLIAASQVAVVLAVFCCATLVPHHRDSRPGRDWLAACAVAIIALVCWSAVRMMALIGWFRDGFGGQGMREDLGAILTLLYPGIQLLVMGSIIYVCSFSFRRLQFALLASIGVGSALALFVVTELGVGRRATTYPQTVAFIKHYIDTHNKGTTPTVYWPIGWTTRPLWFDLQVACYFDWHQLDGNIFNRDNALEGRRRIRLLRPFEMARWREFAGGIPRILERQVEAPMDLPPPTEADLRRLCAEPDIDYVVLRQPFERLYVATDGHWYLYDCRQLRSATDPANEDKLHD